MEEIENKLKLSTNYFKIKNELFDLSVKEKEIDLKKVSDTTEVKLLINQHKVVLKKKFKSGKIFANSDEIIKYFKDEFPDLNKTIIKLYLLRLGFMPQILIYSFCLILSFSCIFYIFQMIVNQFTSLSLIITSIISVVISAMITLSSYPSNIKPNIHKD